MSQQDHGLAATRRELTGRKMRHIRKQGSVPAVLYGYQVEPTKLTLNAREFEAAYKTAGRTTLVDLSVEDARPVKVFVQDVQRHAISNAVQHVDFHAVNLRVTVDAEVPVVLVGESPAVHNNEGVLLRGLETVVVHALPQDLPHQIDVSIEGLTEVDQTITVADLASGRAFEITTDADEMIAKITRQQLDAEAEDAADAAAAADVDAEPETTAQDAPTQE